MPRVRMQHIHVHAATKAWQNGTRLQNALRSPGLFERHQVFWSSQWQAAQLKVLTITIHCLPLNELGRHRQGSRASESCRQVSSSAVQRTELATQNNVQNNHAHHPPCSETLVYPAHSENERRSYKEETSGSAWKACRQGRKEAQGTGKRCRGKVEGIEVWACCC